MSAHSPPPWRVDPDALDERGWTTIVNDGGFVAKCREEDARLIAAAPELLRLVRKVADARMLLGELSNPDGLLLTEEDQAAARALIARIEGEVRADSPGPIGGT